MCLLQTEIIRKKKKKVSVFDNLLREYGYNQFCLMASVTAELLAKTQRTFPLSLLL